MNLTLYKLLIYIGLKWLFLAMTEASKKYEGCQDFTLITAKNHKVDGSQAVQQITSSNLNTHVDFVPE